MEAMIARGTCLIGIKKCHKSLEGNFTMNDEQAFGFFGFNKLSVISLTFFFTNLLFHETGR